MLVVPSKTDVCRNHRSAIRGQQEGETIQAKMKAAGAGRQG